MSTAPTDTEINVNSGTYPTFNDPLEGASPPKADPKKMTAAEIEAAKKKGTLCYRPQTTEIDGKKFMRTADGVVYEVKGRTIKSVVPRPKMSKKQRRKMRKEMGV